MEHIKAVRSASNKDFPSNGVFCVYQLEDLQGKPYYVGQTSNLRERVYQHIIAGKKPNTVSFDVTTKENLNNQEARKIFNLNPKMNKSLPPNDFYKAKSGLKNELMEMVNVMVSELDNDFEIDGSTRLTQKYISTWKYLVIKDVFEKAVGYSKFNIT